MKNLQYRAIKGSSKKLSPMGMGTWAIGGPFYGPDGKNHGWGQVSDDESIKSLKRAYDLGVNVFDCADLYGAGHSETLLGKAFEGNEDLFLISKFGNKFDIKTKKEIGQFTNPEYIRSAIEASLKRMKRDYLDLYLLHIWDYDPQKIGPVLSTLESLVEEDKIKTFGWSTDSTSRVVSMLKSPHFSAIEHELSILANTSEIIDIIEKNELIGFNRTPLAMGFLTGKYTKNSFIDKNDIRGAGVDWIRYFKDGKPNPEFLLKLEKVRSILTSEGRTLVQGALAWIWARSDKMIPVPGFKTIKQIEENIAAMDFGPLSKNQMHEIDEILGSREMIFE